MTNHMCSTPDGVNGKITMTIDGVFDEALGCSTPDGVNGKITPWRL